MGIVDFDHSEYFFYLFTVELERINFTLFLRFSSILEGILPSGDIDGAVEHIQNVVI